MTNPFDIILERLERIESLITAENHLPPAEAIEIIDRKELCKRLDISIPTLSNMEKRKEIPFFKMGSNRKYNWLKVVAALEKQKK